MTDVSFRLVDEGVRHLKQEFSPSDRELRKLMDVLRDRTSDLLTRYGFTQTEKDTILPKIKIAALEHITTCYPHVEMQGGIDAFITDMVSDLKSDEWLGSFAYLVGLASGQSSELFALKTKLVEERQRNRE